MHGNKTDHQRVVMARLCVWMVASGTGGIPAGRVGEVTDMIWKKKKNYKKKTHGAGNPG